MKTAESTVKRRLSRLLALGQRPPEPISPFAANLMPKPFLGKLIQELKWLNGAGTGVSVTQNSGHEECGPCVSLETSNDTVPVRPAKSNGCFGYIASTVTSPNPGWL